MAAIAVVLATGCGGDADSDAADLSDSTTSSTSEASESEAAEADSTDADSVDATAKTETAESSTGEAVGTTADPADIEAAEASAAAFSQCVRDAGVDAPDLAVSADGRIDLGPLVSSVDPTDPAVQQALLSCEGSLEGGLAGSLAGILGSQSFADALVSFSQCVRDDGYDVEDLTFPALAGALLGSGMDPSNPDPNAVVPILATAVGLDPDDPAVVDTVSGCVVVIQSGLAGLGLGG
jgi:hypothetical protein